MAKKMMKMESPEMEDDMMDKEEDSKEMDKYEVESAARTLMEAEKIKKNAKLLQAAKKHLAGQKSDLESFLGGKKITSIADLKKASYEAED